MSPPEKKDEGKRKPVARDPADPVVENQLADDGEGAEITIRDRVKSNVDTLVNTLMCHGDVYKAINEIIDAPDVIPHHFGSPQVPEDFIHPYDKLLKVMDVLERDESVGMKNSLLELVEEAHGDPNYIRQGLIDLMKQCRYQQQATDNKERHKRIDEKKRDAESKGKKFDKNDEPYVVRRSVSEQEKAFASLPSWIHAFDYLQQRVKHHKVKDGALARYTQKFMNHGFDEYFYEQAFKLLDTKTSAADRPGWYKLLEESITPFVTMLDTIKPRSMEPANLMRRAGLEERIIGQFSPGIEKIVPDNITESFKLTEEFKSPGLTSGSEERVVRPAITYAGFFRYLRHKLSDYVHQHSEDKQAQELLAHSKVVFLDRKHEVRR